MYKKNTQLYARSYMYIWRALQGIEKKKEKRKKKLQLFDVDIFPEDYLWNGYYTT